MALSDQFTILQKINFDDAYNAFLGLDKRRQMAVGIAAVVLALLLMVLPLSCVSDQLDAERTEYDKYMDKASEFFGILDEYAKLQHRLDQSQEVFSRMGADSLSAIVYNVAGSNGIEKNRIELKSVASSPNDAIQEVGKEVRMRDVSFDQLVTFMDKLAAYDQLPLTIKKVDIKVDPNKRQIMHQVSFTVSTIKPNK